MLRRTATSLLVALGVATLAAGPARAAEPAPPPGPGAAARVDVDVRMMGGDEVMSRQNFSRLPAEAVGLFLVPQAMLSPTTLDAITTTMLGPPGGLSFDAPAKALLAHLAASTLAAELSAQIRERMRTAPMETGDAWNFDVVIAFHGLRSEEWRPSVQSETAKYCLVTAGVVRVSGQQGLIDTSEFRRGVDARSDGMPAPDCAVLTDYSASGGSLLRRATRDMADVLAAWIVNRSLMNR